MSITFYTKRTNPSESLEVASVKTAWGFVAIAIRQHRLIRVFLPRTTLQDLWQDVTKIFPYFERNNTVCLEFQRHLQNYFRGTSSTLKGEIDLSGKSEFEQSVLKACYTISPATTLTYGQLASKAGYPRAARATGGVMAKNPLPLIIPCHRVIGANGSLTGYSGHGCIAMKQRLIEHEQSQRFA